MAIDQTNFVTGMQASLFSLAQNRRLINGGTIATAVFHVHDHGFFPRGGIVGIAATATTIAAAAAVDFAVSIGNHAVGPFLTGVQFGIAACRFQSGCRHGNVAFETPSERVFVPKVVAGCLPLLPCGGARSCSSTLVVAVAMRRQ